MGTLNPRLERTYANLKPGTPIPVIVTTTGPVNQETLAAARAAGAGPIRGASELAPAYFTTADADTARRLADLPSTRQVSTDEPITAL